MKEQIMNFLKKTKDVLIIVKDFLLKYWMIIVNYLVVVITYSNVYGNENLVGTETILGLWIFVSIAYGVYKIFIKK